MSSPVAATSLTEAPVPDGSVALVPAATSAMPLSLHPLQPSAASPSHTTNRFDMTRSRRGEDPRHTDSPTVLPAATEPGGRVYVKSVRARRGLRAGAPA